MASQRVKVVLDPEFVGKLQRDPAVIAAREQYAQVILQAATISLKHKGEPYPDYQMSSAPSGKTGWHVTVYTDSNHAKYSNAKHNTLTRIVGGAR